MCFVDLSRGASERLHRFARPQNKQQSTLIPLAGGGSGSFGPAVLFATSDEDFALPGRHHVWARTNKFAIWRAKGANCRIIGDSCRYWRRDFPERKGEGTKFSPTTALLSATHFLLFRFGWDYKIKNQRKALTRMRPEMKLQKFFEEA